ncbi:MAG: hypothetical protein EOO65_04020, partial [Methanosarcinales archaeon]
MQYYFEKLGFRFGTGAKADEDMLYSMVASYTEALQWVMLYYIRGCPSWGWFYPFHYAPMISDLRNLTDIPVAFVLGKPFLPFQQLLGCLPAASANFLPACYRYAPPHSLCVDRTRLVRARLACAYDLVCVCLACSSLMTSPTSPLIDFYPPVQTIKSTCACAYAAVHTQARTHVHTHTHPSPCLFTARLHECAADANGKRNAWEAVTLIPFIQESQMLEAIHRHCPDT